MYVISIDGKVFIRSITINNDGTVDCDVTFDIDDALKIGDELQAVRLKRLLMSIDGMVMFIIQEVE